MQFLLKGDTLKVDNGDHYWHGKVTSELFPEEIRDNYTDIIEKSFINYSNDEYSVTNNYENKNLYVINFHYKAKPFTFKRTIEIPMEYCLKDYQDYTNERIELLEKTVSDLQSKLEAVSLEFVQYKLQQNAMIEDEEEEESEEEDSEEEEVEVPVTTKGGKRVTTTVKMKNGRQVTK